ncbi:MAG TPA: transglutaminase-like domain-containing protein [Holophagaceae bacterium]|nr:transglutaminase-like domain-containing protein [Holophagaceae bacterium]
MRASPLLVWVFTALSLAGQEAPPLAFRQWLGGQEVGGSSLVLKQEGGVRRWTSREWLVLSRLGQEIRQDLEQTARRSADGDLAFTWRLQLSAEPFLGRAEWSPREPKVLTLYPAGGPSVKKDVPADAILWPEDLEVRLKEAARTGQALQAVTFSFPVQQWSRLRLEPKGPAPLPGFPDAVRFSGEEAQGQAVAPVDIWVSPTAGELRHRSDLGGIEVLSQRAELPPPTPGKPGAGFFERTLQPLPPHPFLPWLTELTLRAEGAPPDLPEDAQQTRLGKDTWRLRRAAAPSVAEAAQLPVTGPPDALEARYLAPSPLVSFRDPAFDGLLRRMALPPGLPRWDLARRVTSFVFEWIADKDFSVGFASAAEVCRQPKGDCTEHGVLAVALLRRLGVPARGVTGWVGLGETLGLHFWVEVRLKDRWVPVDPTFDEAPASALRIKLGDTDLADLGSVGWEGAAFAFSGVRWVPQQSVSRPWGADTTLQGDQVTASDGSRFRLPGGAWSLQQGALTLRSGQGAAWPVQAVTRPPEAQLRGARRLAGAATLRQGWWDPAQRRLWMDVGRGRWLQWDSVTEAEAFRLLDQLLAPTSSS